MVSSPRAQSAMPVGLQDNSWTKMMDVWALGPENQLEAADPELQPTDQCCFPARLLLETLTTHYWTLWRGWRRAITREDAGILKLMGRHFVDRGQNVQLFSKFNKILSILIWLLGDQNCHSGLITSCQKLSTPHPNISIETSSSPLFYIQTEICRPIQEHRLGQIWHFKGKG